RRRRRRARPPRRPPRRSPPGLDRRRGPTPATAGPRSSSVTVLVVDAREHEYDDPAEVVDSLRSIGARPAEEQDFRDRVFGSPEYFRLWVAQAVSSLGDWLGFLAILVLASRVGASAPGASVGLVMAARIVPGFFLSAGAGVLIDRMDRKQVMVVTMVVRAGVVATLPFVNSVLGLVFASLVLELATLFFSPALAALLPNVVPADKLTTANSLGL